MMRILEKTIYYGKEPAPRVRDPAKPMQVICPGFPRCGTESLQTALLKLGYDHTYHGWDIVFEDPNYMPAWICLCRKKWYGSGGDSNITAADFDAIIGHSVAVTDAAASVFAAEMIAAYPDAKIILNGRKDLDAWHQSAINNLVVPVNENRSLYLISWLTFKGYWSWSVFQRYMWLLLFRATDNKMGEAIRRNGKWVYREHYNMVRGMVPKEKLLEWTVEDGWEPLCKFLDKPVPDEPFPDTNNAAGFAGRLEQWFADNNRALIQNVSTIIAVAAIGIGAAAWRYGPPISSFRRMLDRSIMAIR